MKSYILQEWMRVGGRNRYGVSRPSTAASSGGVSQPGLSSTETLGELAGETPALQGEGSWEASISFLKRIGTMKSHVQPFVAYATKGCPNGRSSSWKVATSMVGRASVA
jgi:hypothetical protein